MQKMQVRLLKAKGFFYIFVFVKQNFMKSYFYKSVSLATNKKTRAGSARALYSPGMLQSNMVFGHVCRFFVSRKCCKGKSKAEK